MWDERGLVSKDTKSPGSLRAEGLGEENSDGDSSSVNSFAFSSGDGSADLDADDKLRYRAESLEAELPLLMGSLDIDDLRGSTLMVVGLSAAVPVVEEDNLLMRSYTSTKESLLLERFRPS